MTYLLLVGDIAQIPSPSVGGSASDPTYGFIYETQEDIPNNAQNVSFPDFSAGLLGYSENFFCRFCGSPFNTT